MTPDLKAWAAFNGLRPAASAFNLAALADSPPAGAAGVARWPCTEESSCFNDRNGRPAAIVIRPRPGDPDRAELAAFVRWLGLSSHVPPMDGFFAAQPNGRHFVVVARPDFVPRWLPEQELA